MSDFFLVRSDSINAADLSIDHNLSKIPLSTYKNNSNSISLIVVTHNDIIISVTIYRLIT